MAAGFCPDRIGGRENARGVRTCSAFGARSPLDVDCAGKLAPREHPFFTKITDEFIDCLADDFRDFYAEKRGNRLEIRALRGTQPEFESRHGPVSARGARHQGT